MRKIFYFLLFLYFLFINVSNVNACKNFLDTKLTNENKHIYKGTFRTEFYYGKAEYEYNLADDGSRIYNGTFNFVGFTTLYDDPNLFYDEHYEWKMSGGELYGIMRGCTKGKGIEVDYDMKIHHSNIEKFGMKIEIKGNYINSKKHGKWIYVGFCMNSQKNNWIPTDSTIINYINGNIDGVCTYKGYSIRKKLLKKEEVPFKKNKVNGKSTITYYNDNGSYEKFDAYFIDGKPSGVWKTINNSGETVIYDFEKHETKFYNDETGEWSIRDYIVGEVHWMKNYHGFHNINLNYYLHRIGGLKKGDAYYKP